MSSGEHHNPADCENGYEAHDPIVCRGMCLVQTENGYKQSAEIEDACVPVHCRECSVSIPQYIMDKHGGQCMNCAAKYCFERLSTWTHGYRPNRKMYAERKQTYDTACETFGTDNQRIESKERQALIQQITEDGGTVWNIVTLLLNESKQAPKGPWRIIMLCEATGSRRAPVVTCRSLHDLHNWFSNSKRHWNVGYEDVMIELADRYDRWTQGKYAKSVPDFIELFFSIVMKITFIHETPTDDYEGYDYYWTDILIGESRMLIRPYISCLDPEHRYCFEVQVHCASCDDKIIYLDQHTPSGPVQCENCTTETMGIIQKSGLHRDLELVFYKCLFAIPQLPCVD